MGRRTVLLVAALVVATLATTLIYLYVRNVGNQYRKDEAQVSVLVAKELIPAGTTGQQASENGWLDTKTVNRGSVAQGAVSQVEPISGLVAQSPIYAGEQILQQKFGRAGTATTLPLDPGQIAISVQLSDPARVAGFVDAGTEVSIFLTAQSATKDGVAQSFTRTLLDRVKVLAKGQATVVSRTTAGQNDQPQTEQIPAAILTLGVTQDQAQKIIFAQSQGELYFGLLDKSSEVDPRRPGTTTDNLFES